MDGYYLEVRERKTGGSGRVVRRRRIPTKLVMSFLADGLRRILRTRGKLRSPRARGRPFDPAVSRAIHLQAQKRKWKFIYPEVIPRHSDLTPKRRQHAEFNLRAAVRSRRTATRRSRAK